MTPLTIGSELELLADRSLIDSRSGEIEFRLHHPMPREVLPFLENEEGYTYRYMTIFRDGDIFRMYYALVKVSFQGTVKVKNPEQICYAQSHDGIQWEKPNVGIFEFQGSTENNIVWMEDEENRLGVSGFSAFRDDNTNCAPAYRYKAVVEAGPVGKKVLGHNGLLTLGSPDGLKWSMISKQTVMTGGPGIGGFDSQNLAFWDKGRAEYRLYRREVFREGKLNVFRDILTATSPDFLHWTTPERLHYTDAVPDQLYTNNVAPYFRAPHLFLGFPTRYVERHWGEPVADLPERERRMAVIRSSGGEPEVVAPTEAGGQRTGTALTDTLFMISRNGRDFDLWDEAFIRPGLRPVNNWFYADNFQSWGLITTPSTIEGAPDELSFFVTEGSRREGKSNICRRYTLRVDGFVSLNAARTGGEAVTRPVIFFGKELVVNFSASAAGSVQVEVQDARGLPLPGFELDNCVELLGDDLERRVRWGGDPDLTSLAGRPVRLRFRLVDADLFSFRFK